MIDFEPPFAASLRKPTSEIDSYAARIQEFTEAGRNARYLPAAGDREKIASFW